MYGDHPEPPFPLVLPMFNHVAWVVEDLQAAIDFLVKHFQCTAGPQRIIEGAWADELSGIKDVKTIYVGVTSLGTNTRIALLRFERPPSKENPDVDELYRMGFRHIGFLVDDIEAKTEELKKAGYKFFSDIVTVEDFESKTVYLWGPEKTVIQLTESIATESSKPS